jgi:AcrR family transcriptional regulator
VKAQAEQSTLVVSNPYQKTNFETKQTRFYDNLDSDVMKETLEEFNPPPRPPGRPRDEMACARIREAAISLLEEVGFANLTCDAIAQRAGTSKATIYRWWPNKVAVVIDAFTRTVAPALPFHEADTLEEYVTVNLRQFAKAICGRNGRILSAIIAAAQHDPAVEQAFLSHWIQPRRTVARKLMQKFQDTGRLPADYDIDQVLDVMYGPAHFLLVVKHTKLTAAYAEKLAHILLQGLTPREKHE